MALGLFQREEALPEQQLAFALAARLVKQRRAHRRDLGPDTGNEAVGLDLTAQALVGDAAVRQEAAAVAHRSSISGSASNRARMPWPTPPLGRPGADAGIQA